MEITTKETREQLHIILDLMIDIENQGIAKTNLSINSGYIAITLYEELLICSSAIYMPQEYNLAIEQLTAVSIEGLTAIPDYKAKKEKQEAADFAKFNELKAKFEPENN